MSTPDADRSTERAPSLTLERASGPAGEVPVVVLDGELDLASAVRFRELLEEAAAAAAPLVVVDLAKVSFMDSTMLRELLRAHRELAGQGARLVVAGAQLTVQRLLALTGTDSLFSLVDTRADALAADGPAG